MTENKDDDHYRKLLTDTTHKLHETYDNDAFGGANQHTCRAVKALKAAVSIISDMICALFSILTPIWEFLIGERASDDINSDCNHDIITRKVYRRLRLRHSILHEVEGFSAIHNVNAELGEKFPSGIQKGQCCANCNASNKTAGTSPAEDIKKVPETNTCSSVSGQPFKLPPPSLRAYNLAVTDLFVEKALTYLNIKARSYNRQGILLLMFALGSMIAAGVNAYLSINNDDHAFFVLGIYTTQQLWIILAMQFMKAFTFYGLLVAIAVFAFRMAKSLFDQSERINDRRHALRQGRLIVHLNDGILNNEELIRAFNWNVSQDNAFSHFNPEAKAPWGNVVAELSKTMRDVAKSMSAIPEAIGKASQKN